jgi:hypothetical protein
VRFLIGCVALMAASVGAQTMYKCQINGKIEYSDKPCPPQGEAELEGRPTYSLKESGEDQYDVRDLYGVRS